MANKKKDKTNDEIKEIKFNKEQIINSNKFTLIEKDMLKVLLEDKQYTLEEVNNILESFNKKEVK